MTNAWNDLNNVVYAALTNHDAILQEKIKTDAELATVRLKLDHVLEQFKLSKQRQFGRSSEKDLIQYDIL